MGSLVGSAYHPVNGSAEEIWEGFCWPCLFFGCFWYMYKGLWGWAVFAFILAWVTFGLSWLAFPFFANAHYADSLRKRGSLTQQEWEGRQRNTAANRETASPGAPPSSIADEISKLAALRDRGVLSEEEFQAQKRRLIS